MHLEVAPVAIEIRFCFYRFADMFSPESDRRFLRKANSVTRQVLFQKVLLKDLLLNHLMLVTLSDILAAGWGKIFVKKMLITGRHDFAYLWMNKRRVSSAVDNDYNDQVRPNDCYC